MVDEQEKAQAAAAQGQPKGPPGPGPTAREPEHDPLHREDDALTTLFAHKTPTPEQAGQISQLRAKGLALAQTIYAIAPRSADQSDAIRLVRQAVMTATQAIVHEGRGLNR